MTVTVALRSEQSDPLAWSQVDGNFSGLATQVNINTGDITAVTATANTAATEAAEALTQIAALDVSTTVDWFASSTFYESLPAGAKGFFTPGTTTTLVLSNAYGTTSNVQPDFDGLIQGLEQFTLSGTSIIFDSAIPIGVENVHVKGGGILVANVPSAGSVGVPQLAADTLSFFTQVSILISSIGASLVGFLQNLTGAVLRTVQSKLAEEVSITDFMTAAQVTDYVNRTETLDLTAPILAALNSKPSWLKVVAPPGTAKCSANLNVQGTWKTLESKGGAVFDFYGNNLTCISVTPTTAGVKTLFSGVKNIQLWCNNLTGTNNIGVLVSGTAFNVQNENIDINYVGLNAGTDGIGYLVQGGVIGSASNSPQIGSHKNIRAIECGHGSGGGIKFDGGTASSGWLTQQVIENTYAATCNGFGNYIRNVNASSMIGVSSESTVGNGLTVDGCSGNTWIGGEIDDSVSFINQGASGANDQVVLNKMFPPNANVADWAQLPGMWLGNVVTFTRIGIPLCNSVLNDTLDFSPNIGKLTVMVRNNIYAEIFLPGAGNTPQILKQSSANLVSTTIGTASNINVYWNAGTSTYRVQNLVGSIVMSLQLLTEE